MVVGLAFTLDGMRLIPGDNAREHWRVKAKRMAAQKTAAWAKTLASDPILPTLEWSKASVIITRIGKRKMDSDNLASSAKAVRDGIAMALGVDDGDGRYTWRYEQELGKEYGVRVSVVLT